MIVIIYDQPNNEIFCNKTERVQYNDLAIMGAIRGTSQTKLYSEFGLESLKFRRGMRRLCIFYKIKTLKAIVNLSSYEKKVTFISA